METTPNTTTILIHLARDRAIGLENAVNSLVGNVVPHQDYVGWTVIARSIPISIQRIGTKWHTFLDIEIQPPSSACPTCEWKRKKQ